MKKIILIFFMLPSLLLMAQYNEQDVHHYVEMYKDIAIQKMYEYRIPASITLAQGVFESACGTSRLAQYGNNHFGIKCHKDWEGDTLRVDDDALQECFRKYATVEESFNDHSLFLTGRPRYKELFSIDYMDYKAWANGLKAAGYATNPKYADRLISLIERFNMAEWDTVCDKLSHTHYFDSVHEYAHYSLRKPVEEMAAETVSSSAAPGAHPPFFTADAKKCETIAYPFTERTVFQNNKTMFVIAKEGDTYKKIAFDVQDNENNIRKYNDAEKKYEPHPNEVVYIERKGRSNAVKTHIVQPSDNLRYISQKYAVQLNYVFKYNNLDEKAVIHPGDFIRLKH